MGTLPATRPLRSLRPNPRDGGRRAAGTIEGSRAALALAALYVASVAARIVLGVQVASPFVFYDELGYARLAQSIATGHGFSLFGHAGLSYAPFYSLVLAPIYALHASGSTAYDAIKVVNAALMSLAV